MTNYAVTLEKLSRRPEALKVLEMLETHFADEVRVHNNMGIIQKRQGNNKEAEEAYKKALEIDSKSFFGNYNMGVFKASVGGGDASIDLEALGYFNKALDLARQNKEEVYEINVLVNLALVYERLKGKLPQAIESLELALQIDS